MVKTETVLKFDTSNSSFFTFLTSILENMKPFFDALFKTVFNLFPFYRLPSYLIQCGSF